MSGKDSGGRQRAQKDPGPGDLVIRVLPLPRTAWLLFDLPPASRSVAPFP